jgi:hypothetical protein
LIFSIKVTNYKFCPKRNAKMCLFETLSLLHKVLEKTFRIMFDLMFEQKFFPLNFKYKLQRLHYQQQAPQVHNGGILWSKLSHYVPYFLPLPLAWAKNVNEYKLAYKSLASNEVNQHTPTWLIFWWGGLGVLDFYCPNLFPSNSQWVFNMFPSFQCVPQHFPHNTSLYFISFCPKFYSCNLFNQPKKKTLQYMYFGTIKLLILFWWRANKKCPWKKKKEKTLGVSMTN